MDKDHDPISESLVFSGHSYVPDMLEEFRAPGIPHDIIMLKDSLEMTDQDRALIKDTAQRRAERGIVITHGTSTMARTAEYLKNHITDKTIVLTGAMRPFSLFRSDAGFNLGGALIAARSLPAGVYLVMNGRVFEAGAVAKNAETGIFEKH